MAEPKVNFDSFKHNGIWEGHLRTLWLDEPAYTIIDSDNYEKISEIQFDCMRKISILCPETLVLLKSWLFDEYQNTIYGSVTAIRNGVQVDIHELTPKIESPEELWNLLGQLTLNVPPENAICADCFFAISFFECPWDEEHGISILFNSDGVPTKIAGYGDHF